ncbi:MAG: hypothetical protein QOF84_4487 [Streptomyces sp.]|jgi:hypothetical protein|nr:hypothetical protein [Streptomyces sp.]MDX6349697.1 hypothetical protein [Streptomyces sp.]
MRISVTRSGGFAGIERHATLDTTGRPDAPHLHALARDTLTTGRGAPPRGVPDGFHYEVTIDGRTIHCADPDLTDAQRELIRTVLKEGA